MMTSRLTAFEKLSDDLLLAQLHFLSVEDICRLAVTSSRWHRLTLHDNVWLRLLKANYLPLSRMGEIHPDIPLHARRVAGARELFRHYYHTGRRLRSGNVQTHRVEFPVVNDVAEMELSKDGRFLAVAFNSLQVIDTTTWKTVPAMVAYEDVVSVKFQTLHASMPSGDHQLMTIGRQTAPESAGLLWRIKYSSQQKKHVLAPCLSLAWQGLARSLSCAAFDDEMAVLASDTEIFVWKLDTTTRPGDRTWKVNQTRTLSGHVGAISMLKLVPGFIISASDADHKVMVWPRDGSQSWEIQLESVPLDVWPLPYPEGFSARQQNASKTAPPLMISCQKSVILWREEEQFGLLTDLSTRPHATDCYQSVPVIGQEAVRMVALPVGNDIKLFYVDDVESKYPDAREVVLARPGAVRPVSRLAFIHERPGHTPKLLAAFSKEPRSGRSDFQWVCTVWDIESHVPLYSVPLLQHSKYTSRHQFVMRANYSQLFFAGKKFAHQVCALDFRAPLPVCAPVASPSSSPSSLRRLMSPPSLVRALSPATAASPTCPVPVVSTPSFARHVSWDTTRLLASLVFFALLIWLPLKYDSANKGDSSSWGVPFGLLSFCFAVLVLDVRGSPWLQRALGAETRLLKKATPDMSRLLTMALAVRRFFADDLGKGLSHVIHQLGFLSLLAAPVLMTLKTQGWVNLPWVVLASPLFCVPFFQAVFALCSFVLDIVLSVRGQPHVSVGADDVSNLEEGLGGDNLSRPMLQQAGWRQRLSNLAPWVFNWSMTPLGTWIVLAAHSTPLMGLALHADGYTDAPMWVIMFVWLLQDGFMALGQVVGAIAGLVLMCWHARQLGLCTLVTAMLVILVVAGGVATLFASSVIALILRITVGEPALIYGVSHLHMLSLPLIGMSSWLLYRRVLKRQYV